MKTIMIIGAGRPQVPLIEASKKEGYHTIVCDSDSNAPGVPLADEYFNVSTKDRSGLLKTAVKNKIDGIVAMIMALSRASLHTNAVSVYESRGFFEI